MARACTSVCGSRVKPISCTAMEPRTSPSSIRTSRPSVPSVGVVYGRASPSKRMTSSGRSEGQISKAADRGRQMGVSSGSSRTSARPVSRNCSAAHSSVQPSAG
ncbi:hypothetical protein GCM10009578_019160 [Streptomyces rhizosphaericus]